jgi:tRNA A37 threonylcarbamoyladenosine synthetase subunit TsaC/SUA5/YrdC
MQVIDSPFHQEYYDKHGQGLHHLGFRVPDVKAYYPLFESFGAPLICSSHWINKEERADLLRLFRHYGEAWVHP